MNNNNNQNISTQEMQDNLYQAMEIITNSIIKDIPYDRTINCTIINDKDKKNGKYTVTNGSATFTAYSETEQYNVNDKVRVNIPEGNYGKNKYIVGKQASEEELEPINYISPLNDFIQITDNLATTFQGADITANATGTGVQKEKILEIDLTKDYNARNSIRQNIFSTIGVEVGFQTLLKQYDLVDGSYGIELKLTFYDGEKKKIQEEKVVFDSSEFFGYPYNFILPTKQQKAFTISRTDLLKTLEIYLYQDNNFQQIKNGKKEYIKPSMMPNIIVTSLSLGFGTNIINIEDNVLELYTLDELEYTDIEDAEENTKRIGFAWYNKDKQNTYLGFTDGIYDSTYDEIDYINKKQISSRLEAEVEKYKKDIPQTTKGIEISADLTDIENAAKSLLSIVDSSLPNLLRRVYRDLTPALSKIFMENPYDADGDNISASSFLERLINNSQQTIGTLAFYYKDNFDKTEKIITYLRNLLKEKATDTIIEQEIQSLENFLQSLKSLNNYLTLSPDTTLFYLISEGVRNSLYANFGGYFSIYDSYNAQIKEAKDKAYDYIQQIEDILAIGKANDIRTRIQSCSAQDEAYTTSLNEDDYKNRYCVYWYRYNQGYTNPEDTIMGTNWERLPEQDNFGIPTIQGEVIDGIVYNSLRTTDTFSIALDSTKDEERFVAVLYYNHQQYKAEPLVFKRKTSDNTVMDLYGSLKINHGKNSKDSYQNYGDDNYLVNSSDTHLERELTLSFTSPQGQTLDDFIGGQIYWYVPKNVSMLKYDSRHKILESYAMGDTVNTVPAGHFKEGYYCFTKAISASAENAKRVDVESLKFAYAIDSYYVPTNSNNTIICKIVKGVWTYTAEISFTFSTFGTSGTEYTLMVKPAGLRTAITEKDDLDLIIKLFNYNNEEIPLYYSTPKDAQGLFGTDFELRWSRYEGALSNQTITPACEIKTDSNNKIIGCTLKAGGQDKISCGIMEVYTTVKFNQQDLTEEDKGGLKHVRINTYYPVPFSKPVEEGGIDYIEGPTSIVYNTLGNTPRYYDCAFKLFNGATGKEKSIGWRVTKDQNGDFPVLDTRNFNHLVPKEIYIKNEKDYPIAYNDNWYQPIIIRQEKYDFDVLNNWDGKLQINEDEDYILSSMMVAGTKDSNNTFTGIIMGDLGKAEGNIRESGLFGFNKGTASFGFKTDGTGFIGAGNGGIIFDGNNAIIKSPDEKGMSINLQDGSITAKWFSLEADNIMLTDKKFLIKGTDFTLSNDGTKNPYLQFNKMLNISQNNFILQSNNENVKIVLQGSTKDEHPGIYAKDNFVLETSGENKKILLSSKEENFPFNINNNFKINWDGSFGVNTWSKEGLITKAGFSVNANGECKMWQGTNYGIFEIRTATEEDQQLQAGIKFNGNSGSPQAFLGFENDSDYSDFKIQGFGSEKKKRVLNISGFESINFDGGIINFSNLDIALDNGSAFKNEILFLNKVTFQAKDEKGNIILPTIPVVKWNGTSASDGRIASQGWVYDWSQNALKPILDTFATTDYVEDYVDQYIMFRSDIIEIIKQVVKADSIKEGV